MQHDLIDASPSLVPSCVFRRGTKSAVTSCKAAFLAYGTPAPRRCGPTQWMGRRMACWKALQVADKGSWSSGLVFRVTTNLQFLGRRDEYTLRSARRLLATKASLTQAYICYSARGGETVLTFLHLERLDVKTSHDKSLNREENNAFGTPLRTYIIPSSCFRLDESSVLLFSFR